MDDQADFLPDGVARIIKLLKDTFGEEFTYYDDNPSAEDIIDSNLPAIAVFETTGNIEPGATMTDDIVEQISIVVILNQKDDVGGSETENLTQRKLRRLVKGQYPDGHAKARQYHENSIMGIIARNYTLEDGSIQTSVATDMYVNPISDSLTTSEAIVSVTIKRLAYVLSRV